MATNPPYLTSQPSLIKLLNKIKEASTPDKFNQKYLNEKLGMKGGTANALPPFLKRIGFTASDGTPTEWYREFRNPMFSGAAAFKALKYAYKEIFEINELAHKRNDAELKGIVAQVTGLDHDNPVSAYIVATFKTLKSVSSFDSPEVSNTDAPEKMIADMRNPNDMLPAQTQTSQVGLNIGYNINLNLPATSDIAVFDAIFKSLKEHLLRD